VATVTVRKRGSASSCKYQCAICAIACNFQENFLAPLADWPEEWDVGRELREGWGGVGWGVGERR
jgi:hypothetical protein